jgi:hypothetical protein
MKPKVEGFIRQLSKPQQLHHDPKLFEKYKKRVLSQKKKFLAKGDEDEANFMWCLHQAFTMHQLYWESFKNIKSGKYYEAWCALEQVEIGIKSLKRHLEKKYLINFALDKIEDKVKKWQSLYPYKMFGSPEMIAKTKLCSICGSRLSIRNRCGHVVGELYEGKICHRVVTEIEFIGMGMVEDPVQKYSVLFLTDEKGDRHDHYDYSVVAYVATLVSTAFAEWKVENTKTYHPHKLYSKYSPDDPCPCESTLSYKECCLKAPGVLRPHLQIHVSELPPKGVPLIVYSADLRSR